jgi:hypothetical protein
LWGNQQEEEANAWRGVAWTPSQADLGLKSLYQARADPDGYTFNNGVLSASILKQHTDAETARAAAVAAQKKSDQWRNGFTANSGPVINYSQVMDPTDYDTYKTNVDKQMDGLTAW